jgi:hypothetical protein
MQAPMIFKFHRLIGLFVSLSLRSVTGIHTQGCALKLQTVKSHHAMAEAMKATASAMHKMNKVR